MTEKKLRAELAESRGEFRASERQGGETDPLDVLGYSHGLEVCEKQEGWVVITGKEGDEFRPVAFFFEFALYRPTARACFRLPTPPASPPPRPCVRPIRSYRLLRFRKTANDCLPQ